MLPETREASEEIVFPFDMCLQIDSSMALYRHGTRTFESEVLPHSNELGVADE